MRPIVRKPPKPSPTSSAHAGLSRSMFGGIDQSIRIEVGGDLHEFGKLVSMKEAQARFDVKAASCALRRCGVVQ